MTKYIFVTGGVVSGLGKGITAASLGRLLKARGLKVAAQKLDPYINVDPGTMSPYQHGEVTTVTVDMGKAELVPAKIPVDFPGDTAVKEKITVLDKEYEVTCVSMGNPHCVIFGKDPDTIDLEKIGPHFEHFEKFPERINTEFIEVLDNHTLKMRVWERGSGETMACGTGACASAVAACLNGYCKKGEDITVKLRGGDLVINYTDDGVQMTGSADTVFTGIVEI